MSIIVVTSPAPLHPDTSMLWSVLHSVDQNIPGLHGCPCIIVCDGYKLVGTAKRKNPYSMSKSGFVQEEAARTYEAYKSVLQHELDLLRPTSHRQHVVLEMKDHAGFALCVKHAMLHAKSTYQSTHSLVLQHDRVFTTKLSAAFIPRCLQTFRLLEHVRYMGFTTTASFNYLAVQRQQFRGVWDRMQEDLAVDVASQDSESPAVLLPMMFWYDSNHLVQIDRALQMYTPFKTVPESLHAAFGGKSGVKAMYMRVGDFIEDRLGQQQRIICNALADKMLQTMQTEDKGTDGKEASLQQQRDVMNQVVRLFGCYLAVSVETDGSGSAWDARLQEQDAALHGSNANDTVLVRTHTVIMHMKGRTRPAPFSRKIVSSTAVEDRVGWAESSPGEATKSREQPRHAQEEEETG